MLGKKQVSTCIVGIKTLWMSMDMCILQYIVVNRTKRSFKTSGG